MAQLSVTFFLPTYLQKFPNRPTLKLDVKYIYFFKLLQNTLFNQKNHQYT